MQDDQQDGGDAQRNIDADTGHRALLRFARGKRADRHALPAIRQRAKRLLQPERQFDEAQGIAAEREEAVRLRHHFWKEGAAESLAHTTGGWRPPGRHGDKRGVIDLAARRPGNRGNAPGGDMQQRQPACIRQPRPHRLLAPVLREGGRQMAVRSGHDNVETFAGKRLLHGIMGDAQAGDLGKALETADDTEKAIRRALGEVARPQDVDLGTA